MARPSLYCHRVTPPRPAEGPRDDHATVYIAIDHYSSRYFPATTRRNPNANPSPLLHSPSKHPEMSVPRLTSNFNNASDFLYALHAGALTGVAASTPRSSHAPPPLLLNVDTTNARSRRGLVTAPLVSAVSRGPWRSSPASDAPKSFQTTDCRLRQCYRAAAAL